MSEGFERFATFNEELFKEITQLLTLEILGKMNSCQSMVILSLCGQSRWLSLKSTLKPIIIS
ncbi:hypothetical protein MtrunA17_Chr7g0229601 [Medicago truncatula]|uniref:Uncharacterized protein n=1 Tax=Medicago truncatula TaxID=3880 RepID=A0A396GXV7_MEDTR|nr:hypothetical protein MtrunA17_Chr7g0229601 [Medicago truncatula]